MQKTSCYADTGTQLFRLEESDRELFDRKLRAWMPPKCFDVHAHLYDLRMLVPGSTPDSFEGPVQVGYDRYLELQRAWLGDRAPTKSLFFPFPVRDLDTAAANRFLLDELRSRNLPRLMLIKPTDDALNIESQLDRDCWSGFKVYHVFASRDHTFDAEAGEFLPEWAWELADRHGLVIMLHLVLPRALADPRNQTYVREHCERNPGARLILAHAARGFCAAHTVDGVETLRGLDNVWFDTSAICEPLAFEAILRTFGTTRLLYGSDFPVSELRGHAMSLGDGFWWLYENFIDWSGWRLGRPTKVGIQSLLSLQQACRGLGLCDADIEKIFSGNARVVLADRDLVRTGGGEPRGQLLYVEAKRLIPGGTQLLSKRPEQFAPGQWPAYYAEANGCEVIDLDGRRYLDFTHNAVGSCLLGYNHPAVTAAVLRRVTLGSMSTLNSPEEVELARRLVTLHPWADQVRLARGGGEALAIAARIVRAATRRDLIAFCGYHGWTDWYLAANLDSERALDGHLLAGLSPAGVPRGLAGSALPFAYNKLDDLLSIVRAHGGELAAVIMEPTRNTPPAAGFLEGVRELCDRVGANLVFDEVTTGFRLHHGGVHLRFGIQPDVAVFAKALGNGHPIAAVIGKSDTMQAAQETFISSTNWTEGVGPAAALSTLEMMAQCDVPGHVRRIGERTRAGLADLATRNRLPLSIGGYPALTMLNFEHPAGAALITMFTIRMLNRGFLAGAAFYPTLAHQDRHVDAFVAAAADVFAEMAESLRLGDTETRIGGPVKQSGFARLT